MSYQTLTNFGYKLRAARRIKGLEGWHLAREVGITVEELNKIERGACDVSIVQAMQLARAVDLSITHLL